MLVLQHVDCEPPAEYEDVPIERGIGVARVLLADAGGLPDWRDYAGVIVMGGPMSAGELIQSLPVMTGVARTLFGNWLDTIVYARQPAG